MKEKRVSEAPEADRVEGHAHPRETYDLIGHEEALMRAARAIRSGRPPQAWLIAGPPGVGKATLAYRIARYVLRHGAMADGPGDLSLQSNDIVSRQIEAQAHPGLLSIKRRADDKDKLKTVITVDDIRRLGPFFGMTAGAGGWRVAIIDSADEMNDNAANALLKILEEPPPRGMLLLVSHSPGRLLPTIRSRCQRLDLKPLGDADLNAALARRIPDMPDSDRDGLVRLSQGSLGFALRLSGEEGLELAGEVDALLAARGTPDYPALLALADRVARMDDGLRHFGAFLTDALSRRIRERAKAGEGDERAIVLFENLRGLQSRALGIHMEPRQTIIAEALAIARAKRRHII